MPPLPPGVEVVTTYDRSALIERAIDNLEEACRQGSRFIPFLSTWSVYDPLRDHPRWPGLLRAAGLLSPWGPESTLHGK